MSKEKECKCCKRIWYEDMLDKKLELCPTCYEYCKPLIDGLKIKYKNIADLEAKLAKSEKERELDNSFWKQECDSLQKTLVEKDKEIEKLNACVDFYKSYYISFNKKVIDELEKVKSAFGLINSKLDKVETIKEYIHYIDHQIKQLKELR